MKYVKNVKNVDSRALLKQVTMESLSVHDAEWRLLCVRMWYSTRQNQKI